MFDDIVAGIPWYTPKKSSTLRIGAVVEYCSLAFSATVLVADALIHLLPHALEVGWRVSDWKC
jgi:hypothetical protein